MSYDPKMPPLTQGGFAEPHRGAMILIFGLLGIFFCPIFAIVAWLMGGADLKKIRAGQMDRAGEGLTQVGYILGIVGAILFVLTIVVWVVMIMIFIGVGLGAAANA
jgi:hypothetical protein